jgi:hypothetical protein
MIRSLRERRLASVAKATVVIHDWPGLIRLAEFDAAYLHFNDTETHTVSIT